MKITKRDTTRIAAVWTVEHVVFIHVASGQNLPPAEAHPSMPLPSMTIIFADQAPSDYRQSTNPRRRNLGEREIIDA